MKHIILILVAMLLPVGALAQTAPVAVKKEGEGGWIVEGKKMDDTPSKKSLHGFGASLVVIKNESFFTEWAQSKKGEGEVKVPFVKSVSKLSPFWVVLFTTGAGVDADKCDVVFDVSVKRPDETEVKSFKNLSACSTDKQEPGVIYISKDYAMVELTLDEPDGKYGIDAVVRDRIKQVELKLFRSVDISASGGGALTLPLLEKKVLVDDHGNPVKELPVEGQTRQAPAQQPANPNMQ